MESRSKGNPLFRPARFGENKHLSSAAIGCALLNIIQTYKEAAAYAGRNLDGPFDSC
jgi:hypothetical protein